MHQLLPPFILEHWKQNILSGRFSATSLVADISGFTAITEALMQHGQHGAEVLADVMRDIFEPLVQSVYSRGGLIAFFAGDAFTALFPDGLAHSSLEPESSALRAVGAAWHIHQHMAAQAEHVTPYGAFTFAVRVGVAAGQVEWSILQSSDGQRRAFYFGGPAIDGCVQSARAACGNAVILSRQVYNAVQSWTAAQPCQAYFQIETFNGDWPARQEIDLVPVQPQEMITFFPPHIVHQRLRGEFRQVIAAFVNLRDTQAHAQLDAVMQHVFDLQERYGGVLTRIESGDKGCVLALLWGAPTSFENDIERALDFVLDLREASPVTLRAGIAYQIAYAGFVGSTLQEEYTSYGQGVNLAARMLAEAPWDSVWSDEAVARRAGPLYQVERIGDLAFKGFAEAQPVFEVKGRRASPPRRLYRGRLIGRRTELERLREFVRPLWEGYFAGAAIVYGEPGIGKSRLLYEFQRDCQSLKGLRLTWFVCQTNETLRESLNPFRYWLRNYFAQSSRNGGKVSLDQKLDTLIAQTPDPALRAELERTRSFLGALIDLRWPGSLYEQLDPQLRFGNTLESLKTLLKAESLRQPVVLHLEDIHWLDADSQRFLQHLTRDVANYPIAILCTSRYPDQYPLPGLSASLFADGTRQMILDLQNLTGDQVAELAEDILDAQAAPPLLALLDERAEGNPFFVEQLLLYLREQSRLEKSPEGLQPVMVKVLLPGDVRSVLIARLDRLSEDVRHVVQTASVLGREFDLSVLFEMLRDDQELPVKVRTAEEQVIWSALSEIRYIFKHALMRDAAYDMQLRSRLRELHSLAADAIEQVAWQNGNLPMYYADLAYHSGQAGNAERERHYARLAGEQAAARYANAQAVRYLNRALELTPDSDYAARYTLLMARERIYDVQGAREAQFETIQSLLALAETSNLDQQRVPAALRRAGYAIATGDFAAAADMLQTATRLAQAIGDLVNEAEGYLHWGRALFFLGDYATAWQQYERGLALARSAGQRQVEANCLHNLGVVADCQSRYDDAIRYYTDSLQIFLDIGDRLAEGTTFNNLGYIANDLGDYAAALAHLEQALRIEREIGDRWGQSQTLNNLCQTHRNRADYAAALDHGWLALNTYREIGDRRGTSYSLVLLGMVLVDLGDYEQAGTWFEQSLNTFREIGNKRGIGLTLRHLGWLAHQQGQHDLSRAYSQQALTIMRELGDQHIEAYILKNLGHALEGLGDLAQAQAAFQQALDLRRQLKQEYLTPEPVAGLARIAHAQHDTALALEQVEEILVYLQDHTFALHGTDEPGCVYSTCYHILAECRDSRAQTVLEAAYRRIQDAAATINDPALRQSFLENVKLHRAIVKAWTQARPAPM